MNIWQKTILITALFVPFLIAHADEDTVATVDPVLTAYAAVHDALVMDDLETAREGAKALEAGATQWLNENPEHTEKLTVQELEKAAGAFIVAQDIDDARKAFIQISKGTIALIRADKALLAKWQLFFCPMVVKQQGYWVQPAGQKLANPFMGSAMPGCGSKKPW